MLGPLRRLSRTPVTRLYMLAQALAALAIARCLTLLPLRAYVRVLGRAEVGTTIPLRQRELEVARRVGSAVQRAAQMVPFKAVCIEQVLAASMILRVWGVPTTAYLGVHHDRRQREKDHLGHNAHAWLQAGSLVIVGGGGLDDYVSIARFS